MSKFHSYQEFEDKLMSYPKPLRCSVVNNLISSGTEEEKRFAKAYKEKVAKEILEGGSEYK